MKATLLGTGDAVGMPVPMCNCEYCQESEKRQRPGLLVEHRDVTLLFDVGPDITDQLHDMEVYDLDAIFVTHFHYDHFWGIQELNHVALEDRAHVFNTEDFDFNGWHDRKFDIYGNLKTRQHMDENHANVATNDNMDFHPIVPGGEVEIGDDIVVRVFPVHHGGEGVTQGYTIEADGKKIVYAPDAWELGGGRLYDEANLMFVEGQLFKMDGHANKEVLEAQIEESNPDRVVLLNITEHMNQMHTDEMKEAAEEKGYEIWSDYDSAEL